MHNKITYTDVVNQVREAGWNIVSQTQDSTHIEKQRGAPMIPAIALALVPVVGLFLSVLWIYLRGTAKVTIERNLTRAHVITSNNAFDINNNEDLDTFITLSDTSGNVGYYPVVIAGIAVSFVLLLLFQVV